MCELFGLNGIKKRELNSQLREFFSHADENPNGWGMAFFDDGEPEILKEDMRADRSSKLAEVLSHPMAHSNMIAHIRLATIGYDELPNTHPFTAPDVSYRTWTLAHNGTVFESGPLSPFFYVQNGFTDSERILLYIIDRISQRTREEGRALSAEERCRVVDESISGIARSNKLNLLIYDGELMYVHTNYRGSLYQKREGGSFYFSTRPLGEEDWSPVPFTRMLAFKDGEQFYEGKSHGLEYLPDENSINALYLAYSGL